MGNAVEPCCCQQQGGDEKGPAEWQRGGNANPSTEEEPRATIGAFEAKPVITKAGYGDAADDSMPLAPALAVEPAPPPPPAVETPPPVEERKSPPGPDLDGAKIVEWQVTLEEGSQPHGFVLGTHANACVVKAIEDNGAVATWNRARPGKEIKPGDLITSVNGSEDGSTLCDKVAEVPRQGPMKLSVTRITEFLVVVDKRTTPLGIGLAVDDNTKALVIAAIRDVGTLHAYNLTATPGLEVFLGDQIAAVNGVSADGEALLQTMAAAETVKMTIQRS